MNPQLAVMATIRGGVFTRADARACGYRDHDIDTLLDSGGWRRIRRGTYAAQRTLIAVDTEMLHLRRLYRLLHGGPGLIASHQSAVALHALPVWGLDLATVHLTAPGGRAGRHAGGLHRHVRRLPADHVELWNGLAVTTPARTLVDLAATATREVAVIVTDAAFRASLVTGTSLAGVLRESGPKRGPAMARVRAVLGSASGRAGSVGESRLRLHLRDAGLPEPAPYPPPTLDDDEEPSALWFAEQRTVVEFDPWLRYWGCWYDDEQAAGSQDPAAMLAQAREPRPVEHVWIPWDDLGRPEAVVDRVRSAFARAASRSGVRTFDPSRSRAVRRRRVAGTGPAPSRGLPC